MKMMTVVSVFFVSLGQPKIPEVSSIIGELELTTSPAIRIPSFASAVLRDLASLLPESAMLFTSSSGEGVLLAC